MLTIAKDTTIQGDPAAVWRVWRPSFPMRSADEEALNLHLYDLAYGLKVPVTLVAVEEMRHWTIEHALPGGRLVVGLEITGGASHLELTLGQPHGVVPVRVRGGASHVTIWRPADVPVGVSVRGGVRELELDDQRFGAIGGRTQVSTGAWRQAESRYDLEIGGGASHLTVAAR